MAAWYVLPMSNAMAVARARARAAPALGCARRPSTEPSSSTADATNSAAGGAQGCKGEWRPVRRAHGRARTQLVGVVIEEGDAPHVGNDGAKGRLLLGSITGCRKGLGSTRGGASRGRGPSPNAAGDAQRRCCAYCRPQTLPAPAKRRLRTRGSRRRRRRRDPRVRRRPLRLAMAMRAGDGPAATTGRDRAAAGCGPPNSRRALVGGRGDPRIPPIEVRKAVVLR